MAERATDDDPVAEFLSVKSEAAAAPDPRFDRLRRTLAGVRRGMLLSVVPSLIVILAFVAFVALVFWKRIVVVIPSGEAGVRYALFGGGTVTDTVYGEGLHIISPLDAMSIYDTRSQMALHSITVLTNKGLPVTLDIAIRYHPEYEMLGLLHQRVGPNYLQTVVIPQVESVLRRNIGKADPEDIYTNKAGILTEIIARAIDETGQQFVTIEDIIIRSVELPPDVKDAIARKLVQQQEAQAYEFRLVTERHEAERKEIEANGIRAFNQIVSTNLSDPLLRWEAIKSTSDLARSSNAKTVVIGGGGASPSLILGGQ
ncbi:SPFH domain-containing protein [Roseiarcus fermentans]|uniref:SPFH domain-containing protein n=1 Tax=Roseiarcus fermentans TaxID=1473586 RepID=A0A366FRL6_9HYPH|nr:prohibitin family protein [Roseiarcus fermentans]RBP17258.1 SPFH domain-containing protein [Roseiarcus fermentans]